jgi:hypothetical protein
MASNPHLAAFPTVDKPLQHYMEAQGYWPPLGLSQQMSEISSSSSKLFLMPNPGRETHRRMLFRGENFHHQRCLYLWIPQQQTTFSP